MSLQGLSWKSELSMQNLCQYLKQSMVFLHPNNHIMEPLGVDLSLETQMMCMDHYEIKLPRYDKFIEKTKCIRIDGMLENRLMHLY